MRVSRVLRELPAGGSTEQQLLALLKSFTEAERTERDAAAKRNGYDSFAMQLAVLLRSSQP